MKRWEDVLASNKIKSTTPSTLKNTFLAIHRIILIEMIQSVWGIDLWIINMVQIQRKFCCIQIPIFSNFGALFLRIASSREVQNTLWHIYIVQITSWMLKQSYLFTFVVNMSEASPKVRLASRRINSQRKREAY